VPSNWCADRPAPPQGLTRSRNTSPRSTPPLWKRCGLVKWLSTTRVAGRFMVTDSCAGSSTRTRRGLVSDAPVTRASRDPGCPCAPRPIRSHRAGGSRPCGRHSKPEQRALVWGHHLRADPARLALPRDRDRHRLPPRGRLRDGRPPAHRTGRRRAHQRRRRPQPRRWGDLPLGQGAINTPAASRPPSPATSTSPSRSGAPGNAGTTPSPSPSSPRSRANASTSAPGPPAPRPAARSSTTSPGSTAPACTAHSATRHPTSSRQPPERTTWRR
jgi:hypothetical protein